MVDEMQEHRPIKFDLKKNEITADAVAQIDKLSERNCYVPMERFEEVMNENRFLRNELKKVTGDFWIYISEAHEISGIPIKTIYSMMRNGNISSIGDDFRKKVSRFEIMQIAKRKGIKNEKCSCD